MIIDDRHQKNVYNSVKFTHRRFQRAENNGLFVILLKNFAGRTSYIYTWILNWKSRQNPTSTKSN